MKCGWLTISPLRCAKVRDLLWTALRTVRWASNWPHAQADKVGYPDDVNNLDLLAEWAPDEATRHKILVTNPAGLYDT